MCNMANSISILAIPGSLRPDSSSHKVIEAIAAIKDDTVDLKVWNGLADIPPFDGAEDVAPAVRDFRAAIQAADAVLICTPEYAFGIPGALKNALDWTVVSGSLNEKVTGLITASSNGIYAHEAMLLVLRALGARVPDGGRLLIRFIKAVLDEGGHIKDEGVRQQLIGFWHVLIAAVPQDTQS